MLSSEVCPDPKDPNRVVELIRHLAAQPPPHRRMVDRVPSPKKFRDGLCEFSLYAGEEMVGLICVQVALEERLQEILQNIEAELAKRRKSA